MVTNITSFGRSGLHDWMMQRVTAVILLAYVLFIAGYLLFASDLSYVSWVQLFQHNGMRIFSLLALLSTALHAWIGLWGVSTDYIKSTGLRFAFQCGCGLIVFSYVVWGVQIFWGV